MNEKVSIIVPCYEQGEFLADTLNSVCSQTYQNWECIIVNDGSSDDTENIAKSYCDKDARFKYLYQDNAGVSAARNAGIANTDGYYILPLDADDLIAEDYLNQVVGYFGRNPDCKVVYCKARFFGKINCNWDLGEYSFETLLWKNCIFCSAVYRRQDFLLTPGYNTNMVDGWEDWDFWLSLLNKNDIVHQLDSVMFYYRIKHLSRNTEACNSMGRLYEQVMNNHSGLYSDIKNRELEFYAKSKFLEQDIQDIRCSRSYKVGQFITSPVRKIKELIKKV